MRGLRAIAVVYRWLISPYEERGFQQPSFCTA
nr:MAG TPA: hypothetical protein [Caudoviricetes sp.]